MGIAARGINSVVKIFRTTLCHDFALVFSDFGGMHFLNCEDKRGQAAYLVVGKNKGAPH